jgi:hypothetical protein
MSRFSTPQSSRQPKCSFAACGKVTSGYTAAVNTCAFGAFSGAGDSCGRCFMITSNKDPYSPAYTGPFNSIVVKVDNLCPRSEPGTPGWCDQTVSHPVNQYGMSMQCVLTPLDPRYAENETNRSFDLCEDSGTAAAFFPKGRGAMLGTFKEVECEGNFLVPKKKNKYEGVSLWRHSCMANHTTPLWPGVGCSNSGTNHSLACTAMTFWLMCLLRIPAPMSGLHKYGTCCS